MTSRSGPSRQSASGNPDFDFAPGQPNHYRIMRFKQDLVRQLGPEGAVSAFRDTFGWPKGAQARRLPVRSERDIAALRAVLFLETDVAGIAFTNDQPPVVGEAKGRSLHGVTRSQYVACLQDVRTRGRSSALLVGKELLFDFQSGELERVDEELSWDPAVLHAEGGAVPESAWYLEAANESDPIHVPEAFNLLGAHADFFGHWMCEYLPKLVYAALTGRLPQVPLLIDANMPPSHRRSIELLFPDRGPILEIPSFASVLVDRLWLVPDISYYPLYDAGTGKFQWDAISVSDKRIGPISVELRRRAEEHCGRCTPAAPRVFLARKPVRHRRLVNDEEIYAEARRRGFVIIYPEDLTFDEQVSHMLGAKNIIVSEGSAIFLAQFAAAGTKVCMLSHPMNDPMSDFNVMLRNLGIGFSGLVGPVVQHQETTPHDSSYRIDRELFASYLDGWLGPD